MTCAAAKCSTCQRTSSARYTAQVRSIERRRKSSFVKIIGDFRALLCKTRLDARAFPRPNQRESPSGRRNDPVKDYKDTVILQIILDAFAILLGIGSMRAHVESERPNVSPPGRHLPPSLRGSDR